MRPSDFAKFSLCLLLLWNLSDSAESHHHGNYEEWGKISEVCDKGKSQSPINFLTKNVTRINKCGNLLKLVNYNAKANHLSIHKHGRSARLSGLWKGNNKPSIISSVLSNQTYVFYDAHIHWAQRDDDGTEHCFEGKKYAAELHSVHINEKYGNFSKALNYSDGLAVLAVLFKVDDKIPENVGMQKLAAFHHADSSKNTTNSSIDLSLFFPSTVKSFYFYKGSLTTPPCTENVRWIVLAEPVPISSKTMSLLRKSDPDSIHSKSVRPPQPINDRKIELYDQCN